VTGGVAPTLFLTSALEGSEWSASRPGRALPPGKEPPVPIVQEAGWAPEPVWTQRLEKKSSAPVGDRTPTFHTGPRTWTDCLERPKQRKVYTIFGMWHVRLSSEAAQLDLVGVRKVTLDNGGNELADCYTFGTVSQETARAWSTEGEKKMARRYCLFRKHRGPNTLRTNTLRNFQQHSSPSRGPISVRQRLPPTSPSLPFHIHECVYTENDISFRPSNFESLRTVSVVSHYQPMFSERRCIHVTYNAPPCARTP
jgi:hypothetical protein